MAQTGPLRTFREVCFQTCDTASDTTVVFRASVKELSYADTIKVVKPMSAQRPTEVLDRTLNARCCIMLTSYIGLRGQRIGRP